MPGSLSHLTRRFFEVLISAPLDGAETAAVDGWLRPPQAELFFAQEPKDQRHGYRAGLVVLASGHDDPAVLEAALLHDIGKRHANLGVLGRVWVSLGIRLSMPLSARGRLYRDHGELAARELEAIGAADLSVHFARHHHGSRPESIEPDVWALLQLADEPAKTRGRDRAGIS